MAKDNNKLDKIVAEARRARDLREQGYREQALKMYPHVCGRCGREFSGKNLRELTVHHRDHDHDNEHQRQLEAQQGSSTTGNNSATTATFNPFADLKSMLDSKK
jgi:hypothetical protein